MRLAEFETIFGLWGKVLGIKRTDDALPTKGKAVFKTRCTISSLLYAMEGNTVCLTEKNSPCKGGLIGLGLKDGLPDIPGGFGHFISCGRGQGFPPGERLKSNPATGEQMILSQPQNVLNGQQGIVIKPFMDGDSSEIISIVCNPDQLSAMIFLFNYSKTGEQYDTVIAPAVAGCASIFRIPFGELRSNEPRAVIGLSDINARVSFDKSLLTFTISKNDFERMLQDADESFAKTDLWEKIYQRMDDK